MFGLMTVARHEREMAKDTEAFGRTLADSTRNLMAMVNVAERNADHWRTLAEQLIADMADLMRRQAPPVPGPEESEMGTIADDDHTPSAIAKREKAVGARN